MKICKYKIAMVFSLLSIIVFGQTYDKKVSEKFKVNGDVELVINSSYTDVEITTWNRNEVVVEGTIEVEGVSKEEAQKILNNWNFEVLGNKNKIKIVSLGQSMSNGFMFNFSDMNIDIPEFEMPEMEFEFELPEMPELPEIPDMSELEITEFSYEKYKNDTTYLKKYKKEIAKELEEFRNSGWKQKVDSIRNSEEYKRAKEDFKKNKEVYKRQLNEMKKEMSKNDKLIQESTEMALKMVEEMNKNGDFEELIENFSGHVYFDREGSQSKKIRIRKEIHIKVPKNATFKLNVRHGKLNIPDSNKKMSVNMSYGNFTGGMIVGNNNELIISNSPIAINTIESANITLKNVPNATFGTFSNVNLFSNYSDVFIKTAGKNNALSNKFGNLNIYKSIEDFESMNVILDYSKATIKMPVSPFLFQLNNKKSTINLNRVFSKLSDTATQGVQIIEGFNKTKTSTNKLHLTSVYSTVSVN